MELQRSSSSERGGFAPPGADLVKIVDEYARRIQLTYPSESLYTYHNYAHHITTALRDAFEIAERCIAHGLSPRLPLLKAIVCGHDAAGGIPPLVFGVATAEEAAAECSVRLLSALGAPKEFIEDVRAGILETAADRTPRSLEARIMRAADLAGTARTFEEFEGNTRRLYDEFIKTSGASVSYATWLPNSINYLGRFAQVHLELTPLAWDSAGRSVWHIGTLINVIRAMREQDSQVRIAVILDEEGIGQIEVHQSAQLIICPIELYASAAKICGPGRVVFPVPFRDGVPSLPDPLV